MYVPVCIQVSELVRLIVNQCYSLFYFSYYVVVLPKITKFSRTLSKVGATAINHLCMHLVVLFFASSSFAIVYKIWPHITPYNILMLSLIYYQH